MPILASFMVPHPPLIIPEIGRGGEAQISLTSDSYHKIAKEIAFLEPDTIIITSPHAPYYSDSFFLSDGDSIDGNFSNYRADSVSFHETINSNFIDILEHICIENDFPIIREAMKSLDHGTMVPLYFIRKYYSKGKIVVIGCSQLAMIQHYQLGKFIQDTITQTKERVVLVASGDLSHKLQEYGPYGFVPEGPIYDERIMKDASSAQFGHFLSYDPHFLDVVAQCGHPSFTIMAGALDGIGVLPTFYSHQDVTGVGYGICSFYPTGRDIDRKFGREYIRNMSHDPFVLLARKAIFEYVQNGKTISPIKEKSMINQRAGVFVSIHKFGKLRGCIGTILPTTDSIYREIIQNAISAATRDPRFSPITEDELEFLEISVDVLSTPEIVHNYFELDPKRYGVIVSSGMKRGLLLPDLDGIDDIPTQIEIAMRKGNITIDEEITIQKFEVVRHK